ncbi:beta-1,3-1,4-glucanase [Ascobolus immersus RN42]|uniref:endo-1,3(4)-beta-glucanase n=1 Tax=Ascobolus immersus RN42 TaxID=1160509 RepID=A0A3N4HGB1_ASCIM|nr:beta-1,3-1,4-glucanase [Ascobolus immersus RN42]
MKHFSALLLGITTLLALPSIDAAYSVLEEQYRGEDFFNKFDFWNQKDPTKGYVNYVDRGTAQANGLIAADSRGAYIGVDSKTIPGPEGRMSVRLESKKRFNRGLFLFDVQHMPGGICGTWPAIWTLGEGLWPGNGEIDVIEGVHNNNYNHIALHTTEGCTTTSQAQKGQTLTPNCFISAPGQDNNAGCGTRDWDTRSYGAGFNANGGGVYAMEWNSEHIKVWFFPRGQIPADIQGSNPEPVNWGVPVAEFKGGCDIDKHFKAHRIIINTTFCGDWAGAVFAQSGCGAGSCEAWVKNNPQAFKEAYWQMNSIRVFSS